jgi:4-amino-4-deoxy-L-arabinose transferase-like glycosyltransferase
VPQLSSRLIGVLVAVFVSFGLVYETVTPVFEAGDEQFHYAYVKHIADGLGLPLQDPAHVQPWRQEGSQPPLYYILGAAASAWIDTGDVGERLRLNPHAIVGVPAYGSNDNRNMIVHSEVEQFPYQRTTLAVHLLRWLSLLMGAATVFATYRLALRVAGGTVVALLSAAIVGFNPMFLFLSAAVNNDNLVILLSTLSIWQMVRIWQDGAAARKLLLLGVLVGLAVLSKLRALGLVGVAGLLVMTNFWQSNDIHRRPSIACRLRSLAIRYLLLIMPVLLLAGWWYARNFILYGDLTGLNRMLAIVGTRQGTPQFLPLLRAEAEGLFLSYWGLFGGVNILAAPWVYAVLAVGLTLVGGLGLLWSVVRYLARIQSQGKSDRPLPPVATGFAWPLLWLLVLLVSWARWTLITPATQGRLIFPAIAVVAVALASGAQALARIAPLGRRANASFALLLSTALCVVALRVAIFDIAPSYVPPPLLSAPPAATREPLRFGDTLALLDSQIGDVVGAKLAVTLTWQATALMSTDYSVFVHLLDAGELIVGQRDSYPGLGLRPTSQLKASDVVRDVYQITIDPSAIRPSKPEVRVGVYDFANGKRLPSAQGDNPVIGSVILPALPGSDEPNPVTFHFENYFSLSGYRIEQVALRSGEALSLTLYWHADNPPPKDYSVFTHVLGQNDALWAQVDRQLPMTQWRPGQVITDIHVLQLKPDTPPEVYQIEIGAYDLSDNFKRLNIWSADGQFIGDRLLLRKIRVLGR